jgi:O-acetyl-ADP-ribose deacetylase (regulator of RNase III)
METLQIGGATLRLVQGDITEQQVDAIVNAANSGLLGGGGVDGAIHRRGGAEILAACRELRAGRFADGLPTGQAAATTAGGLPARRVIHTVGPRWKGGGRGEAELLASAYRTSLEVADDEGLRTVAFPAISTGAYGYPSEEATRVAIDSVVTFLREHADAFDELRFVVFSDAHREVYEREMREVEATVGEMDGSR